MSSTVLEADWVVVGGGSAGYVAAARLSEDPSADVVLLEAGPGAHAVRLGAASVPTEASS